MSRIHLVVSTALLVLWLLLCWRVGPPTGDFANYYTAAALVVEGADPTLLYDYRWFTAQADRLGFPDQLVGFAVLTPPSALLALPLVPLGPEIAANVWWIIQALLGWALAAVAARTIGRPLWAGLLPLLLLWPALDSHLSQGQFHLVAVSALAGAALALRRARDGLAGVGVGLAVGLKVHAWPLLAGALLLGRWRLAGAGFGTLLVGGLVSVAVLGWPVHRLYLETIGPAAASGMFIDPWHPAFGSLGHAIRRALLPHPGLNPALIGAGWPVLAAAAPRLVEALAVTGVLALVLRRGGRSGAALAALSTVALITGPLMARYHLVLLAPAMAWAADDAARAGHRGRAAALLLLPALAAGAPVELGGGWSLARFALLCLWLIAALWTLPAPEGPRPWRRWGALAALVLGLTRSPQLPGSDAATPIDGPGFPLIAADLLRTDDGSLWFSGLSADRGGLHGLGWIGFRLRPGADTPERVAGGGHRWSPVATGPDTVTWTERPMPTESAALDGQVVARDGDVSTV